MLHYDPLISVQSTILAAIQYSMASGFPPKWHFGDDKDGKVQS